MRVRHVVRVERGTDRGGAPPHALPRESQLKKPLLFLLWADRASLRAVGATRLPASVRLLASVRPPASCSPAVASAVSADGDSSSARASASDSDWSSWSREAATCCAERSLSAEKRSE